MKHGLPRDFKVYIVLGTLLVAMVLMLPRTATFSYDYKKGSPWMYETLIAQFDFPILKTQAQLLAEREAAGSSVIPYYKVSEEAVSASFRAIEASNLGPALQGVKDILRNIYERGVLDEQYAQQSELIYIQKDKRASKYPQSEVYTLQSAKAALPYELAKLQLGFNVDSLLSACGVYNLIQPNLIFDASTTDLVHDQAVDYISPTSGVVNAGRIIVNNGEIVTAEIHQMLDSYAVEFEKSLGYEGSRVWMWLGNILIALCFVLILLFTILFTNQSVFADFNRFLYLIIIVFLTSLVAFTVEKAGHHYIYLVPFSLMALYLVSFFKTRVVYPVYVISLLPMLVFCTDGIELFVMYLVSGIVAIFSFRKFNRGWQQFLTAFFVYISLVITYLMFRLNQGISDLTDLRPFANMAFGALFSVAGYPLIYLFERIFMLVSNSRLQELCDTNSRLLTDLAQKAPGTFQHSLQVMNMCESVAKAIDANVDLVRCGSLYHDIGKINNPLCFVENEALGMDYHKDLSPIASAKMIIKHVSDGLELAQKNKIPPIIQDFIASHHGTTFTAYFYNEFIKAGGDPDQKEAFYYKGLRPRTKEQTILMICDSIEAASRTLKDFSPEAISEFVERICAGKVAQGQFEDADLTMREYYIMRQELKEYIAQAHHVRVEYPK